MDDTAKCIEITCTFPRLAAGAYGLINIHSRLWNGTLVSEYKKADKVLIQSRAEIVLDPNTDLTQDTIDDDAFTVSDTRPTEDESVIDTVLLFQVETVALPDFSSTEPDGVAVWIYIVAILAGLIIVCLIGYCLYRLGFFKRKRPNTEGKPANYRKP